nr:hypothetical protein [Nocardia carnea]
MDAKGITRMTWAQGHGGSQLPMTDQHRVLRTLGEYDGSTAWTMAINAAMPYMISLFGDRTTSEVLNSENTRACGVFALTGTATPTAGGMLVTGRWEFVSGQNHSGWVLVPAMLDGTERLALLVPRSEFTVGDEWDVNGLIGTGSNTLTLEDTFVPQHRAIPLDNILSGICSDPETTDHDPYYRQPLVPIICALSAGPPAEPDSAETADVRRAGVTRFSFGSDLSVGNCPATEPRRPCAELRCQATPVTPCGGETLAAWNSTVCRSRSPTSLHWGWSTSVTSPRCESKTALSED